MRIEERLRILKSIFIFQSQVTILHSKLKTTQNVNSKFHKLENII